MPYGNESFNSSTFRTPRSTDGKPPRNRDRTFIRRERKPTIVQQRLQIARECPIDDSPELVRLMRYRDWLLKSNGDPKELHAIDGVIELFKERARIEEEPVELSTENAEAEEGATAMEEVVVEPQPEDNNNNDVNESGSMAANEGAQEYDDVLAEAYELEIEAKRNTFNMALGKQPSDGMESGRSRTLAAVIDARKALVYKPLRLPRHALLTTIIPSLDAANPLETKAPDTENADKEVIKSPVTELITYRQPKAFLGNYLRNLQPEEEQNPSSEAVNIDDEIDVCTAKMESTFITQLNERKIPDCICNRKVQTTRCMSCEEILIGRVFRRCAYHPTYSSPDDHLYCTKCLADITYLREIVDV